MSPRSVVKSFLSSLAREINATKTLLLTLSNDRVLEFSPIGREVSGRDRLNSCGQDEYYEFVVADIPVGMGGREKAQIGQSTVSIRKNWAELAKALGLLNQSGFCIALVEPPAFGISEGPRFIEALEADGYSLCGIFNVPPNLLRTTSIRPVLVAFSRQTSNRVFVAQLEEEAQAEAVAKAFALGNSSESLLEGILLEQGSFVGFESLKAKLQLERLETQYKEYTTYTLGELSEEINCVKSGEVLKHKENSIYFPMLGSSAVTHDLSAVTIKHHNVIQAVLSLKVKSEYVSAFFRSDLGLLILRSLTRGAIIPKIRKSDIEQAPVALPSLEEQDEIIRSHGQLQSLSEAIDAFQKELALNPRNASAVRSQVESMLEQIGGLTIADRIMRMAREGESATVEFKESFSLDKKKGTKEKYIELATMKTIVAFLNTNGGVLLIGITDTGDAVGVGEEIKKFHKNSDAFLLHFKNQLKERVGEQYYPFIDQRMVDLGGAWVLMVDCKSAPVPCYLDKKDFYVRTNPATDKLEGPKLVEYVQNHFNR